MRYRIQRLDRRFSYRGIFSHCIKFSARMTKEQGPLSFAQVQKWFAETYGWSAEIRQYTDILGYQFRTHNPLTKDYETVYPEICNPHWSWTNGYDDLRIYVRSDQELNFFLLRWPRE